VAENKRNLSGAWAASARLLAAALPLSTIVYALQVLPAIGLVIYKEQFLAWFLTLALILTFISIPAFKNGLDDSTARELESVPWYDVVLIVAAAAAGGYTTFRYHVLLPEIGLLTLDKIVASTAGIVLLLEATRRLAGNTMLIVGMTALAYAYFGNHLDGLFATRVIRADRLMLYNYMGQDAIHGTPLFVAATIVAAFMLFGQVLFAVGAGKAISDFGFALMGRRRGGPAKVSIVASALFGSLSGSASANVATTGMITIPMIRRAGYADYKAGAIEAVASTGGLILPPIMAATGFIMAEFLGIPYAQVAIAATFPAVLFYTCLFMQVDLEAAKVNMTGLAAEEIPALRPTLRAVAPVVIPIGVLLYALFVLYRSPEASALAATVATLLVSVLVPSMRRSLGRYLAVLASTGEAVVYVAIVCAVAGLVVGCLGLTGLANTLSQSLVDVADGRVWLLILLAAAASIVLGMGVPVTATYIILVILVGPALVDLGIPALSAHMFVFYFGTLSFLTPPVCISVFVAAALAKANPMKTALFAMRLGAVAYLVPFFFVFNEGFLLIGPPSAIVNAVAGSLAGVLLLSVGLVGFFVVPVGTALRGAVLTVGVMALTIGAQSWQFAVTSWLALIGLYALQRASSLKAA
jgi:TRAP transporter 4TM/12TM fusion protein